MGDDQAALTADIIELARQYGRYGYRRITALLRRAGWTVDKKRVERIWRCEGLKSPAKQPSEDGCGSTTVVASVCSRSGPLCLVLRLRCGSHPRRQGVPCVSSMSSAVRAWPSVSRVSSRQAMSATPSASCSSRGVSLRTYVQIMALNSSPRRSGIGSPRSGHDRLDRTWKSLGK
jgi:hypothetical protein